MVYLFRDRENLSWVCDKPSFNGSSMEMILVWKGMTRNSRNEIKKFNG
jgi:hypothetical protein